MKAEIYWIAGLPRGRLAVLPRPRGGDWLEDEVRSLRRAGVDALLSLLTKEEMAELGLVGESQCCAAFGIEFISFPINDRAVPASAAEALPVVQRLVKLLAEGKAVAIHCRQGVGRSAVMAACVLASIGETPDAAFERISQARGRPVPDTPEQREWVRRFVDRYVTPPGRYAELVRDALASRHMEGSGCFWSNRDCRLLQEVGAPALPAVEAVLLREVLPFYYCSTESLGSKFPGLLSLLVTYFAIGKDMGDDRVIAFCRRLYGSRRVDAIRAISIVWLCRPPPAPSPEPLLAVIRELAEEGTGSVQEVAHRLLVRASGQEETPAVTAGRVRSGHPKEG